MRAATRPTLVVKVAYLASRARIWRQQALRRPLSALAVVLAPTKKYLVRVSTRCPGQVDAPAARLVIIKLRRGKCRAPVALLVIILPQLAPLHANQYVQLASIRMLGQAHARAAMQASISPAHPASALLAHRAQYRSLRAHLHAPNARQGAIQNLLLPYVYRASLELIKSIQALLGALCV